MKISPGQLPQTLLAELETLSNDMVERINERSDAIAKGAVRRLREASPRRSGRYAKGWTFKREAAFGKPHSYIIYNKDMPGLAHLLEHGHAKRGGGRVVGRPHIAPVEKELVAGYMAMVEEVIRG